MNISKETLSILKSFANINQGILIEPGNQLKIVSAQKTVFAIANVNESFEKELAIYDLNQFLSSISLFDKPEFVFKDKSVDISSNGSSVRYYFASRDMIQTPPKKNIELPDVLAEFDLKEKILNETLKAASVLQAPHWCIVGNDGELYVEVTDTKNDTSNAFKATLDTCDKDFRIVFKVDNLKIMPRDYHVKVSEKGISHFVSSDDNLQYYIAAEVK